jgi:hypothetical protein
MSDLRDGLGGEELRVSGLQAGGVNISPYFTGSITSASNITSLGSVIGAVVTNSNGKFMANIVGSPAAYGILIQTGSIATSAGSVATIVFGQQFATVGKYYVQAQAINTSGTAFVSGTKNVSGCVIVGEASTTYDYIAAGL